MSCNIKIDKNGINQVLADNGSRSLLFDEILKLPTVNTEDEQLALYQEVKKRSGKGFFEDVNGEPIIMFTSRSSYNQLGLPNKNVFSNSYSEALKADKENRGVEIGLLRNDNVVSLGEVDKLVSKLRDRALYSNEQLLATNNNLTLVVDSKYNNFIPLIQTSRNSTDNTISGFINGLVDQGFITPEKVNLSQIEQAPETEDQVLDLQVLDMGEGNKTMSASIDSRPIGALRVKEVENGYQVTGITVNKDYRGLGIATELYYMAVEELGKPLYSDTSQTKEAASLWMKFERQGLAQKTDDGWVLTKTPNISEVKPLDLIISELTNSGEITSSCKF